MSTGGLIKKPSVVFLIFAACFALWLVDFWRPINVYNKQSMFDNDMFFQRYSYLPAMFMNGASFEWNKTADKNPKGPDGRHLPKYNYGMSVMYAPGFFTAWAECKLFNKPTGGGFSNRFASYVHWLGILYALTGLLFVRKLLLCYYGEGVTTLVLFSGLFGSLLFYYCFAQSEMPHAHLFFLFSFFLWLIRAWHNKPGPFLSVALGMVLGLISLINPFDLYVVLFFFFWNTKGFGSLKNKLAFFIRNKNSLLWCLVAFVLLWIPQLWFNVSRTGWLFYDLSPKEHYDFLDAGLWQVLLSYKQGWFLYSPVALLFFLSVFFSNYPAIERRYVIGVFILVWYVYSCSWDWHAGKNYGATTFCEAFVWLALPFAGFISSAFNNSQQTLIAAIKKIFIVGLVFSSALIVMGWTYKLNEGFYEPLKMDAQKYWSLILSFKK